VGPNVKAFGFSTSVAWVVGVSCREEITRSLKPLEAPTNRGPLRRRQDTTAGVSRRIQTWFRSYHLRSQPSAGRLIPSSVKDIMVPPLGEASGPHLVDPLLGAGGRRHAMGSVLWTRCCTAVLRWIAERWPFKHVRYAGRAD
jgi:hypothetical protein